MKFIKTCMKIFFVGGGIASGILLLASIRRNQTKSRPQEVSFSFTEKPRKKANETPPSEESLSVSPNAGTTPPENIEEPPKIDTNEARTSSPLPKDTSPSDEAEAKTTSEEAPEYYKGFLVQRGAKGGKFYINDKGKKIYIKDKGQGSKPKT